MTARIVTCLLFSLLFCRISASVVCTGDSALFKIDVAREPVVGLVSLPYNSSWVGNNPSATVVINDNGVEIYRGSGEGSFTGRSNRPVIIANRGTLGRISEPINAPQKLFIGSSCGVAL